MAKIQILYSSGWQQAFLHYRKNDEIAWTHLPGIAFGEVGKDGLRMAQVEDAMKLQFLCNDGESRWDKAPGNQHYCVVTPGCYKLIRGNIERVGGYVSEMALAQLSDLDNSTREGSLLNSASSAASQSEDESHHSSNCGMAPEGHETFEQHIGEDATPRGCAAILKDEAILQQDTPSFVSIEGDKVTQCSGNVEPFCSSEHKDSFAMKSMSSTASSSASNFIDSSQVESTPSWEEVQAPSGSHSSLWGGITTVVAAAGKFRKLGLIFGVGDRKQPAATTPDNCQSSIDESDCTHEFHKIPSDLTLPTDFETMRKQIQSIVTESRCRSQGRLEGVDHIQLTYESGWNDVFLHCRVDMGDWTTLPGIKMMKLQGMVCPNDSLATKWVHKVTGRTLEFIFHNGKGAWDHACGKQNYVIHRAGEYLLLDGHLKRTGPPPQPPKLGVVNRVGPSSLELGWNPPDVEDGIEHYRVYQEGIQVPVVETDAATRTCILRNLKGAMTYRFKVTTVDVDNNESDGIRIEGTTSTPGKPSAPASLHVTSKGIDHITLGWQRPEDLGGASVTAYQVFRDGAAHARVISPNPESSEDLTQISWTDKTVTKGRKYSYSVSALHLPKRSLSNSDLVEAMTKRASKSSLEVAPEDNEGPRCHPVETKAVSDLRMPKLGEQVTRVMLQGFNWESCDNKDGWYKVLLSKIGELKVAGFDMIWLPPPAKSEDRQGYLPTKWYDLDSNYGTEDDLINLSEALHEAGICPMLDLVVNHRCATKKDGEGKWTIFEQPAWGREAICRGKDRNDPNNIGTGRECTGQPIPYAPNIDHRNPKVQKDVNDWVTWMMGTIGIRALRLDYVIGFEPSIQEMYVRAAGSPFTVAEYWHGDREVLHNYIRATKGQVAVFDFPVYYTLKHCVHSNDYAGLRLDGRPPGIMGVDPVRSCTFIENHDTIHLAVVGGGFGNAEQIVRGFVYILTHPGTPTVFWSYWSDWGNEVRDKINACVKIRREAGLHCASKCIIRVAEWGLYAAEIEGNAGSVAVKLGSNDWRPNGSGWHCALCGNCFCVWVRR